MNSTWESLEGANRHLLTYGYPPHTVNGYIIESPSTYQVVLKELQLIHRIMMKKLAIFLEKKMLNLINDLQVQIENEEATEEGIDNEMHSNGQE